MTDSTAIKPPTWFWVVAGIALIWNLLGVMAYIGTVTMSPDALAAMPDEERALMESRPAWVTGAFAVAVFAGALGCLLLLLKKRLALLVLGISLLAVLVQMYHSFFMTNASEVFGAFNGIVMPIVVIVIAVLLVRLASSAKSKKWIN